MPLITYGNATGSIRTKRNWNKTADGVSTYTVTLEGDFNVLESTVASMSYGSVPVDTFISSSVYGLATAQLETLTAGNGRAVINYNTSTINTPTMPPNSFVEQSAIIQEPIMRHPDFSYWDSLGQVWWERKSDGTHYNSARENPTDIFVDFTDASGKANIKNWDVPTTQIITTTYYSSRPSSPADEVGTLSVPSVASGTDKWKIDAAIRQKQGNWWTIVRTYTYSAIGWNTDVYYT